MLRIALPLAFAVMTVTSPAFAEDTATASQPEATQEKPAKEKKICKSDVGTGSIMPRRTCRTKAEWDAISARAQTDLEHAKSRDMSRSVGGITR